LVDPTFDFQGLAEDLGRGIINSFYIDIVDLTANRPLRVEPYKIQLSLWRIGFYYLVDKGAESRQYVGDPSWKHTARFPWDLLCLDKRVSAYEKTARSLRKELERPVKVECVPRLVSENVTLRDRSYRKPTPLPGIPQYATPGKRGLGLCIQGTHQVVDCKQSLTYGASLFHVILYVLVAYRTIKELGLGSTFGMRREVSLCLYTLQRIGFRIEGQDGLFFTHVKNTIHMSLRRKPA